MGKAIFFTETEKARLTAAVKNDVLETETESNPHLWVNIEIQIISWFNFQGFKILIDGCVFILGNCALLFLS